MSNLSPKEYAKSKGAIAHYPLLFALFMSKQDQPYNVILGWEKFILEYPEAIKGRSI